MSLLLAGFHSGLADRGDAHQSPTRKPARGQGATLRRQPPGSTLAQVIRPVSSRTPT